MTYRNDHDAAIARIDALEAENARLAAQVKDPAVPDLSREGLAIVGLLLLAGICYAVLATLAGSDSAPAPNIVTCAKPTVEISVETCEGILAPMPTREGVEHDPHGPSLMPDAGFRAGCRDEIYTRLERISLSIEERRALQRWLAAEDTLATARSLLESYYTTNEIGDVSSRWTNFEHAFEDRQHAIEAWRRAP